jgi:hypothetical protein
MSERGQRVLGAVTDAVYADPDGHQVLERVEEDLLLEGGVAVGEELVGLVD